MVGSQDAGGILEDLLVHGNGFVEPAARPVGAGEFVAWGEGVGVVGTQGVAGLSNGFSESKGYLRHLKAGCALQCLGEL